MRRLNNRLKKLEARITDEHGLVPHSPKWMAYWVTQMDRALAGERLAIKIPLEFVDALLAVARVARNLPRGSNPLTNLAAAKELNRNPGRMARRINRRRN